MKYILGIDPGLKGGMALYNTHEGTIEVRHMPATFPDIYEMILELLAVAGGASNVTAYMENVGHGMPGQSSSATATFARHNGHLEMALYALGVRTEMVTPQKWQKTYSNTISKPAVSKDASATVKSKAKRDWKALLKGQAQRLFPSVRVTLDNADAILLAYYGSKQ